MQRIGKLKAESFYELIDPFYTDLSYFYKSLQDDVLALNKKAIKHKWTPQQLEHEIDKMFSLPDDNVGKGMGDGVSDGRSSATTDIMGLQHRDSEEDRVRDVLKSARTFLVGRVEKAWQVKSGKWHDYGDGGKVIEVPAPGGKGKGEEDKPGLPKPTKYEEATDKWNKMTPLERFEIMKKVPRKNNESLPKWHRRIIGSMVEGKGNKSDEAEIALIDKEKAIRSPQFKQWFGDWESDPQNASKVVNKSGKPQETERMSSSGAKTVFHGTAHEFNTFDKNKLLPGLYGKGFYFTEDKEIAETYRQKDFDTYKAGIGIDRKEIMEKLRKKIPPPVFELFRIAVDEGYPVVMEEDMRRFNPKLKDKPEKMKVAIERHKKLWAAAIKWENENPENDANEIMDIARNVAGSKSRDRATFSPDYSRQLMEKYKVESKTNENPGKVFEVFLNIRKPFDLDSDTINVLEMPEDLRKKFSMIEPWLESHGNKALYDVLSFHIGDNDLLNNYLMKKGYDGLTHIGGMHMGEKKHKVWIAFEPNQIKSAAMNTGKFDPNEADVRKSLFVAKSFLENRIEKAKAFPPGTIRERSDGKYKKMNDGQWVRVSEPGEGKPAPGLQIHFDSEEDAAKVKDAVQKKWGAGGIKKLYDTMHYYEGSDEAMLHLKIDPKAPYRIIMTMTEGENPKEGAHAVAHFNTKNDIMVVQELFHPENIRGDGEGAARLWSMMDGARTYLGAKRVNVQTKRKPDDPSYYVAVRLGAYKQVKVSEFKTAEGRQAIMDYMKSHNMPGIQLQVQDLMKTPEGRELWKKHGFGMFVSWNPKKDSDSMKNLRKYAEAKHAEKKKEKEEQQKAKEEAAKKKDWMEDALPPAPSAEKPAEAPKPAEPKQWEPPADPDINVVVLQGAFGKSKMYSRFGEIQPTSPKAMAAVSKAENGIQARKTEKGMAFDKDGNLLHWKTGNSHRIKWFQKDMDKFVGCEVLTHNHPGYGGSFSYADIQFAVLLGIKEMRACSMYGNYSVKINFKVPPPTQMHKSMVMGGMQKLYNKYQKQTDAELHEQIKSTAMTQNDANFIYAHKIIEKFLGDEKMKEVFNIEYKSEGVKK